MEKMTLGCYLGFIKRSCLSWVGWVHNKEPPVENIPSVPSTQHDYGSMIMMEKKNRPKFAFQTVPTQHNYDFS